MALASNIESVVGEIDPPDFEFAPDPIFTASERVMKRDPAPHRPVEDDDWKRRIPMENLPLEMPIPSHDHGSSVDFSSDSCSSGDSGDCGGDSSSGASD